MGEDEEKDKPKGKASITFALIMLLAVVIFGTAIRELESNKVYQEAGMYIGERADAAIDPRVQYAQQVKSTVLSGAKCSTVMESAKSAQELNGYCWINDKNQIPDAATLQAFVDSTSSNTLTGVFLDGDYIVSVSELLFLNSNTQSLDVDGIVTVTVQVGNSYVIEFKDVAAWWCHYGKSNAADNVHTAVVGKGGYNEKCLRGYRIAQAKSTTTAVLYELQDDGTLVEGDWSVFYGFSGGD